MKEIISTIIELFKISNEHKIAVGGEKTHHHETENYSRLPSEKMQIKKNGATSLTYLKENQQFFTHYKNHSKIREREILLDRQKLKKVMTSRSALLGMLKNIL